MAAAARLVGETPGVAVAAMSYPFTGNPSDPSTTITLQSSRPETNYFIWSLGVSAQFIHGISGYIEYQRLESFEFISFHDVSMGLRFQKSF